MISTNLDEEKEDHRADDVSFPLFSLQYSVVFKRTLILTRNKLLLLFLWHCMFFLILSFSAVHCKLYSGLSNFLSPRLFELLDCLSHI